MNTNTKRASKGFTLLEILLVIAAIGILAAIVLVAINPNRQIAQARNTVRQADINTIQKAVEQYLIENGSYPSSISTTPGYICNTGTEQVGGSTNCSGRVDLRELVPDYIAGIPRDPQATGTNTGYIVAINPDNNKISISSVQAEGKAIVSNPFIVTNGLVLNLDAGNLASYPGTGNTWFDLSGNGNNGTLVNGVGYNSTNGGALSFDGVNDYVVTGNSGITGNQSWSLSIWVSVNVSENGAGRQGWIIWEGASNQSINQLISIGVNGGKVEVAHWGNDTVFLNSSINFGNFQNITVTFNGSQELIYINSVNTNSKSTSLNVTDGSWYFASREGGTEFLNCNIAQVSIYNRALTPEEIQQNFNATRGRFGL
jgi:prepilin-type N-terminal cleavage/methylation domain-containing protein